MKTNTNLWLSLVPGILAHQFSFSLFILKQNETITLCYVTAASLSRIKVKKIIIDVLSIGKFQITAFSLSKHLNYLPPLLKQTIWLISPFLYLFE